MKLCFVCREYPPGPTGGIGVFTQVLARALVGVGHEVRVVGVYPRNYPAPDQEIDHGVRVWRFREPAYRLGWLAARYQLFRTIAKWVRQREIELVEVPDWEGWAAGWPRLAAPVVTRLHGSASYFQAEMGQPRIRSLYYLERASLRRADFWSSVSQYTAGKSKTLFGLRDGPHAILNPFTLTDVKCSAARSRGDVIFTGSLLAKKGVIPLIQAWPRVLQAFPEARLQMFGKDGGTEDRQSMMEFLKSQLDENARQRVCFHGHAPRELLLQHLQTARLAVFPSYAEAFASAPLEAMSYGCPTIYSQRGAGPELITEGTDGLLVNPDNREEIADAILRLLTDDTLARDLGAAGQRRVRESFSLAAQVPRNAAFYEACVSGFSAQRARGWFSRQVA